MRFTVQLTKAGASTPMWRVVVPYDESPQFLKLGADGLFTLNRMLADVETTAGASDEGIIITFRATPVMLEKFSRVLDWLRNPTLA